MAGGELWVAVVAQFDPEPHELRLLLETCREVDLCEALAAQLAEEGLTVAGSRGQSRVNGLVAELRQHRLALTRMVEALRLEGEQLPETEASRRARRAADARWSKTRRARDERAQLRGVPS